MMTIKSWMILFSQKRQKCLFHIEIDSLWKIYVIAHEKISVVCVANTLENKFIFTFVKIERRFFGGKSESKPAGRNESQLMEMRYLINRYRVRKVMVVLITSQVLNNYCPLNNPREFERIFFSQLYDPDNNCQWRINVIVSIFFTFFLH